MRSKAGTHLSPDLHADPADVGNQAAHDLRIQIGRIELDHVEQDAHKVVQMLMVQQEGKGSIQVGSDPLFEVKNLLALNCPPKTEGGDEQSVSDHMNDVKLTCHSIQQQQCGLQIHGIGMCFDGVKKVSPHHLQLLILTRDQTDVKVQADLSGTVILGSQQVLGLSPQELHSVILEEKRSK